MLRFAGTLRFCAAQSSTDIVPNQDVEAAEQKGDGVKSQTKNEIESPLYEIEEESQSVGAQKTQMMVTKTYSRLNQRVLVEIVTTKSEEKLTEHLYFGEANVFLLNKDSPLMPRGTHVTMGPVMSAFGWYGDKSKDMFEVFFSPDIKNNLLTKKDGDAYRLLGAKQIEKIDAEGPIVLLEEMLGINCGAQNNGSSLLVLTENRKRKSDIHSTGILRVFIASYLNGR